MPSRVWSHLCDYAMSDASGKASIIGEFDKIFVQQIPVRHPLFFLSTKWEVTSGEQFEYRARLLAPSGAEVVAIPPQAVNATQDGNVILINAFMMVELLEFGTYTIDIRVNDVPTHAVALTVELVRQTAPPGGTR